MSSAIGKGILIASLAVLCWTALVASSRRGDEAGGAALDADGPSTVPANNPPSTGGLGETVGTPVATEATRVDHTQHQALAQQASLSVRPRNAPPERIPRDKLDRFLVEWDTLSATTIEGDSRPRFPKALAEADGHTVVLTGYMTPLDQVGMMNLFLLLELPVGCFFCQAPAPNGIVLVELPTGTRTSLHYHPITVTGTLHLNRDDPEDFLYIVYDAQVRQAE